MSDNTISKYDRKRGNLDGVALFTKPTTVKWVEPLTGKSETYIVETARLRSHERDEGIAERADIRDTIFVECMDESGVTRLALPPRVSAAIARQRDALTARVRSQAAKEQAQARMAAGHVPFKRRVTRSKP